MDDYVYWRGAKAAYDTTPGCKGGDASAPVRQTNHTIPVAQAGCRIVEGTIVSKKRVTGSRRSDHYFVGVAVANGSPQQERIAYGDEGPLLQLYHSDVTVIYYNKYPLRTWNNPDSQVSEIVATLELLGLCAIFLVGLGGIWIGLKTVATTRDA